MSIQKKLCFIEKYINKYLLFCQKYTKLFQNNIFSKKSAQTKDLYHNYFFFLNLDFIYIDFSNFYKILQKYKIYYKKFQSFFLETIFFKLY